MESQEALLLNAVDAYFAEKIKNINLLIERSYKYPLSLFRDHAKEVMSIATSRLREANTTQDPATWAGYIAIAWLYLERLNEQIETLKLVKGSESEDRWQLLRYVTSDAAKRINLRSEPLPLFGGSFYATGSFSYHYRVGYAPKLSYPFYQISVDCTDTTLFWVLVAHELGHCKASEISVKGLEDKLREHGLVEDKYKRRLEESISDCLATRLYGYAYPISFFVKSCPVSFQIDDYYPRPSFRYVLMLRTLENMGLEIPQIIRKFIIFNEDDTRGEETAFLQNDIIKFCAEIVSKPDYSSREIENLASNVKRVPEGRIDMLFNAAWFAFLQHFKDLGEVSQEVYETLKRWSSRSDSLGQR